VDVLHTANMSEAWRLFVSLEMSTRASEHVVSPAH